MYQRLSYFKILYTHTLHLHSYCSEYFVLIPEKSECQSIQRCLYLKRSSIHYHNKQI